MGVLVYVDIILILLSLFVITIYHTYLWHCIKNKPCQTSFGNHVKPALTNNAYKATHLLHGAFSGSQSGGIYALKFGSASLFLLTSFLCSFMGLGFLVDANFLENIADCENTSPEYTHMVSEQGFMLAHIGNRILFISFPLLTWLFGPVPVALSSLALIWGFY